MSCKLHLQPLNLLGYKNEPCYKKLGISVSPPTDIQFAVGRKSHPRRIAIPCDASSEES
jgi:hypothetical protein